MEVINEFRQAIEIESHRNAEDYALVMALPPNERIAKGVTLANFTLTFDFRELPYSQYNETIEFPLSYINSARINCADNKTK